MKNTPVELDGKTHWISRSVAVGVCVFGNDQRGNLCLLANKRGDGCEFMKGLWNIPGGFIDYDETVEEAACRECKEETGVIINPEELIMTSLNSDPKKSSRQIVAIEFACAVDKPVEEIELTDKYSEPNEVAEIKWIPITEIRNYKWTRNQLEYIQTAIQKLVKGAN